MIRSRLAPGRWAELWRYYQAGVVNTLFGYALYAGFVRLGLNLYVAQILAHLIGMAFNYVTYSRHVFRGAQPARGRFVLAYAFNYLVGLSTLWGASHLVRSPYLAGIVSILCASIINYFVLKRAVFVRPPA